MLLAQVADISWHGLDGLKDGFLPTLAALGFHGDYGAAHDYGDIADDMIGVFEWNVTSYATEWFVPTEDLAAIYSEHYGSDNVVTDEMLGACAGMLLVGRVAEQEAGRVLYYQYARQAPVMLDLFRDHFRQELPSSIIDYDFLLLSPRDT